MSSIRRPSLVALIFAFLLSLSLPTQAFAVGFTTFFLIDRLETDSQGPGFKIVPEGTVENPDGCASSAAYHSVVDPSFPGNSQRLSLALVALTAGREARVWISGCSAEGLPRVYRVNVR